MNKNKKTSCKAAVFKKMQKRGKSKYGILLVLMLAIVILVINIVSASYAWFSPDSQEGIGVQFYQDDYVRSEQCSFTLHEGSVDSGGVLTYPKQILSTATTEQVNSNKYVTSSTVTQSSVDPRSSGLMYYEIIVSNEDTKNGSDVSLYFNNVPAGTTLGVKAPSNSCHTYSASTNDVAIVRNAYVKKLNLTEVEPGMLRVEFFVKCTSANFSFDDTNIYMVYN